MIYLIGLVAILNGMADIAFAKKRVVATVPAAPVEPLYCPCRSVAWNEALEQATHDGNGTVH
jgi:hypothetical protein